MVSGLGIPPYGPIRFLFLTESDYSPLASNFWIPRTIPVAANYDSYGKPSGSCDPSLIESALDLFRMDAVTMSVGQNEYHEMAVDPENMTWEEAILASSQDRLRVRPDYCSLEEASEAKWHPSVTPDTASNYRRNNLKNPHVPSYKSIREALGSSVLRSSVLISKIRRNLYLIRTPIGGSNVKQIDAAHKKLSVVFSVAVTTYERGKALLVAPAYSKKNKNQDALYYSFWNHSKKEKSPSRVKMGFIREDVWQDIVLPYNGEDKFKKSFNFLKEEILPAWVNIFKGSIRLNDLYDYMLKMEKSFSYEDPRQQLISSLLSPTGHILSVRGITFNQHFIRTLRIFHDEGLPVPDSLLHSYIGAQNMYPVLSSMRKGFQPSHFLGSQDVCPVKEHQTLRKILVISSKSVKEHREKRGVCSL